MKTHHTRHALLFIAFLVCCSRSFASHIVGLELYYSYMSGNDYTITLIAYGDCGPSSSAAFSSLPTSTPTICIFDGATSVSSISLAVQNPSTGIEVTPVCPADVGNTQCTNVSNPYPGIKKFVYSGTFTVPYRSATWRFVFEGDMGSGASFAGRAAAITNILSGTDTHLEDTLNNTSVNNSTCIMTTVPVPFFCLNNNDSYNPGAVDPDGDSLSFSLADGIAGSGNCSVAALPATYNPPFTGAAPLSVTPASFTFDQHTGQMSFFPDILQRALVVYNVEEYRHGVFVGSCQREMTFLVITCTQTPPSGGLEGTTAGTIFSSDRVKICQNSGPFDLIINPTESDTNNAIKVTASGIPAGARFSTVGDSTNHPHCTFSWTSDNIPVGLYIFYLTYRDNACPLSGTQTNAISISILPPSHIEANGKANSCLDQAAVLTATGGISYSWIPAAGLSCDSCAVTNAPNFLAAVYTVTGTDANGCKGTDTANIVLSAPTYIPMLYNVTTDRAVNYGSKLQLEAHGGLYYYWKPNDGSLDNPNISNPKVAPLKKTIYSLTTYNERGCYDTANVVVEVITTKELIPTAFTPNGDGMNDAFRIENLQFGRLLEMNVYNRWGQRILHTADNAKGWDGTYQGTPQDMGTYSYYIIIEREDGEKVSYKGDVVLIR